MTARTRQRAIPQAMSNKLSLQRYVYRPPRPRRAHWLAASSTAAVSAGCARRESRAACGLARGWLRGRALLLRVAGPEGDRRVIMAGEGSGRLAEGGGCNLPFFPPPGAVCFAVLVVVRLTGLFVLLLGALSESFPYLLSCDLRRVGVLLSTCLVQQDSTHLPWRRSPARRT